MVRRLELREARSTTVWDIDVTQLQQAPMILEQQGKPVAVVIGIEEYRRLAAWQDYESWRQEQLRRLQPQQEAFHRLLPDLLEAHEGKFAAIRNGQVVGTDEDRRALAQRMRQEGHWPVYIQRVMAGPRVVELPSPEVVRNAAL